MKAQYTISDILDLRQNGMLKVDPEYQRGVVWKSPQQKRFLDSIFRGYPIPLIYLHHIKKTVAGKSRDDFAIIDGQQRINALHEFKEGVFSLFDPKKDDREAKFPNFVKDADCPWANSKFETLSTDLRATFLNTPLSVVEITPDSSNEVRDLFIRLQAGLPLNAQEKRDAWPGGFTDFVLRIAGKPEITRYPGHDFFRKLVAGNQQTGRGKKRQLCAQMAMLFIERRINNDWVDIKTRSIDDYYYRNLDFNASSPLAERFKTILNVLTSLLGKDRRKPLRAHEAIHLLLLVDNLQDEYTKSWYQTIAPAFDRFRNEVAKGRSTRNSPRPSEFWTEYDARTRTASDEAETIEARHKFFTKKMLEYMGPLQLKDPKRLFGEVERELIYYRDDKMCFFCNSEIIWSELEIHHVKSHVEGGLTRLENGRAVHKQCHPRGQAALEFSGGGRETTDPTQLMMKESPELKFDLGTPSSVEEPLGACPHGVSRTKICNICEPEKYRRMYGD
jgi:hypothetical protein